MFVFFNSVSIWLALGIYRARPTYTFCIEDELPSSRDHMYQRWYGELIYSLTAL